MASSSSSSHVKHDVFISFRGTDTRHGLLSHLKRALRQNGIDVYVDDRLETGNEISPALLQAIEESRISLVIFSKDYASSKWCLKELEKVIECKKIHKHTVIPVFYNVDPTDVRHQSGTYKDAFTKHEEKFQESDVQNWRSALKEAAELSGFHYPSKFQDEADMVGAIVKDVLAKLSTTYPSEPLKGLVGIHQNLACQESLLDTNSTKVRIHGIWSMPRIYGTNIARAASDIFSSRNSFTENVKELGKNGLSYLLKQTLPKKICIEYDEVRRREESQRHVMLKKPTIGSTTVRPNTTVENSVLLTANFPSSNKRPEDKPRVWCDHCNKLYHTRETCWLIHGKPPNWKPKQKQNQNQNNPKTYNHKS